MSNYMVSKKTMEINPEHPIVIELKKKSDGQKRQDRQGLDLASFRHCPLGLRILIGRTILIRHQNPQNDQAGLVNR
jgi:hypothetical protein